MDCSSNEQSIIFLHITTTFIQITIYLYNSTTSPYTSPEPIHLSDFLKYRYFLIF